jgi:glycosyltransferase involved in cell wall biosynthesis
MMPTSASLAEARLSLRVCAITPGPSLPSSRFRWQQYEPFLRDAQIDPTELHTKRGAIPPPSRVIRPAWLLANFLDARSVVRVANEFPVRFLQREMISTLCTAEVGLKSPLVFDVDDATFLNQRFGGVDRVAKLASLIICGNAFLADHFSQFAEIKILPTAVDTVRFSPAPQSARRRVIGWSGSSSGFQYLYQIEDALRAVLNKFPDVKLRVVADQRPRFNSLPESQVEFLAWSPKTEVVHIQDLAIGIMPLADSPWERGKCSFKMLTYMAVGVPVVVSPVGMNLLIMKQGEPGLMARNTDEWVDALSSLLNDENRSAEMGKQGRQIIEAHYAAKNLGAELAAVLRQQADGH